MWNKPSSEELSKLPPFYSTEEVPLKEKMIHMHFFIGGCDWYAAEYSPEEKIFFGFAILNGDLDNAEWGYFSLQELCDLKVKFLEVDRDLYWKPKKAIEIDKIVLAQGWEIKGGDKNDRSSAVVSV
jgi:hypothetical protein